MLKVIEVDKSGQSYAQKLRDVGERSPGLDDKAVNREVCKIKAVVQPNKTLTDFTRILPQTRESWRVSMTKQLMIARMGREI